MRKKRFASIDRACRYAGISPATAYRLIKSGALTKYKVGRRTRLDLSEIDRWRKQTREPRPALRAATGPSSEQKKKILQKYLDKLAQRVESQ